MNALMPETGPRPRQQGQPALHQAALTELSGLQKEEGSKREEDTGVPAELERSVGTDMTKIQPSHV